MRKLFQKSFTLIEILVYIGVLSIIISAIVSFVLWFLRSNTKAKAMREVLDNARRAMEIITHEIKEAESIYTPTSVFDFHPGQLSLETLKYLPEGEGISYIDFYLCDDHLCFKKESQDSIVLTTDNVEVNNLIFTKITTGDISSIKIDLKIDYENPANRPEYQASATLESTASLRSY